jgi:hypothetical protein
MVTPVVPSPTRWIQPASGNPRAARWLWPRCNLTLLLRALLILLTFFFLDLVLVCDGVLSVLDPVLFSFVFSLGGMPTGWPIKSPALCALARLIWSSKSLFSGELPEVLWFLLLGCPSGLVDGSACFQFSVLVSLASIKLELKCWTTFFCISSFWLFGAKCSWSMEEK